MSLRLLLAALFSGIAPLLGGEVVMDAVTGRPARYAGNLDPRPVRLPEKYRPRRGELRGIWVTTYNNLDLTVSATPEEFKNQFLRIVTALQKAGINAVFFQVRPQNDAFYRSTLNPWSRFLNGVEGRGWKNFDPLPFMIGECHRRKIAFHAWLNPYRVTLSASGGKTAYLRTLSALNFARRNPQAVLTVKNGKADALVLNPGEPAVRDHIYRTVREILDRYPVDGIHFDDYFYPYDGIGQLDLDSCRRNNPNRLSPEEWRRNNVNVLIRHTGELVRAASRKQHRKIEFGVSPFGIWMNRKNHPAGSLSSGKESYRVQFADTRRWVKERWIDYIVPQIYWPFGHEKAPFAALTDWWCNAVRGTGVKLYVGHGLYRLGEKGFPASEITRQLRYANGRPEVSGAVLFRCRHFLEPQNRSQRLGADEIRKLWRQNP